MSNADLPLCFPNSGDKAAAETRVKELEEALATQAAESKKAADTAQRSAAAREKEYTERLGGLAQNVRGKEPSFCIPPVYPLGSM